MLPKGSFVGYIADTLNLEINSNELQTCLGYCLRYITMGDSYVEFNANMRKLLDFKQFPFSESDFRVQVRGNGYLLTGLKYFALAFAKGKNCPVRAEDLYPKYAIFRCDAKAIKNLYEVKGFKAGLLRDTTFNTKKETISPEALTETVNSFLTVLPTVTKYAKFLIKNLHFINSANNFQRDEFQSEFIVAALRAYYYIAPTFKEGLELENYLRSSMKKHQVNIIKAYTTSSRARMINAGPDAHGNDRFVMQLVSQSQLNGLKDDGDELEYDGLFTESSREAVEREEFLLSVDRLILKTLNSKSRARRKRGELLAIIIGRPNRRFERHLRKKNLLRSEIKCYSDFIDEKPREVFLDEISNYLKLDLRCVHNHLAVIGTQLALQPS